MVFRFFDSNTDKWYYLREGNKILPHGLNSNSISICSGMLFLFDHRIRRDVRDETIDLASERFQEQGNQLLRTENSIVAAGLKSIERVSNATSWPGWSGLFKVDGVKKIRIALNYSERWLGTNGPQIEAFLRKDGTSVEMLVPNPKSKDAISCIAEQKSSNPESIAELIQKTVERLRNYGPRITVKMINKPMSYQLYMFEDIPIVLMFPLKDEKDSRPFPLFEFHAKGEMSDYFRGEFDRIWNDKDTQDFPM